MTLEILSVAAGNGSSSGGGSVETRDRSGGPTETRAKGAPAADSFGPSATRAVEGKVAVEPTPVTAKAARVELKVESLQGEKVFEYPITGPDKFAKAVNEQSRMEAEKAEKEAALERASERNRPVEMEEPEPVREEAPAPEADAKVAKSDAEPAPEAAAEPAPETANAEAAQAAAPRPDDV